VTKLGSTIKLTRAFKRNCFVRIYRHNNNNFKEMHDKPTCAEHGNTMTRKKNSRQRTTVLSYHWSLFSSIQEPRVTNYVTNITRNLRERRLVG